MKRSVALEESDWETLSFALEVYVGARSAEAKKQRASALRFGAEAFLDSAERARELDADAANMAGLLGEIGRQLQDVETHA